MISQAQQARAVQCVQLRTCANRSKTVGHMTGARHLWGRLVEEITVPCRGESARRYSDDMVRHAHPCYAIVMSIRRITISVPAKVAARIKKAAGDSPVSAWVTGVVEERLEDAELERQWREFCRHVHPSRDEVRRADAMFRRLTKRGRRKRAA